MTRHLSNKQTRALAAKRTYSVGWRFHAPHCKAPALDCTCDPHIAYMPDVNREGYEAGIAMHNARAARIRRGLS